MLQRTGEAETITTHYLFALGIYRTLYIPNWFYRYFAEGHVDRISWMAGIAQTILYSDFFYIYYTKYAAMLPFKHLGSGSADDAQSPDGQTIQPSRISGQTRRGDAHSDVRCSCTYLEIKSAGKLGRGALDRPLCTEASCHFWSRLAALRVD